MSRSVQEQLEAMKANPSFNHPPGMRRKQTSKYRKDNWKNLKEIIVRDRSFFDKLSVKLEGNDARWEKSVDMGKILEESWHIESSDFMEMKINAANDFFAPTRQVESLEQTTVELNNINQRVERDIAAYEAAQNQDDVFQLLDEDDDIHFTTGFDRKSIMEESKQKVNVMLEVDYKKQQAKKEGVLNDLKGWFDEMKNDNLAEFDIDAEEPGKRFSDEPVNALLASAHAAKDRLLDIHTEIIERNRYSQS